MMASGQSFPDVGKPHFPCHPTRFCLVAHGGCNATLFAGHYWPALELWPS